VQVRQVRTRPAAEAQRTIAPARGRSARTARGRPARQRFVAMSHRTRTSRVEGALPRTVYVRVTVARLTPERRASKRTSAMHARATTHRAVARAIVRVEESTARTAMDQLRERIVPATSNAIRRRKQLVDQPSSQMGRGTTTGKSSVARMDAPDRHAIAVITIARTRQPVHQTSNHTLVLVGIAALTPVAVGLPAVVTFPVVCVIVVTLGLAPASQQGNAGEANVRDFTNRSVISDMVKVNRKQKRLALQIVVVLASMGHRVISVSGAPNCPDPKQRPVDCTGNGFCYSALGITNGCRGARTCENGVINHYHGPYVWKLQHPYRIHTAVCYRDGHPCGAIPTYPNLCRINDDCVFSQLSGLLGVAYTSTGCGDGELGSSCRNKIAAGSCRQCTSHCGPDSCFCKHDFTIADGDHACVNRDQGNRVNCNCGTP